MPFPLTLLKPSPLKQGAAASAPIRRTESDASDPGSGGSGSSGGGGPQVPETRVVVQVWCGRELLGSAALDWRSLVHPSFRPHALEAPPVHAHPGSAGSAAEAEGSAR